MKRLTLDEVNKLLATKDLTFVMSNEDFICDISDSWSGKYYGCIGNHVVLDKGLISIYYYAQGRCMAYNYRVEDIKTTDIMKIFRTNTLNNIWRR